MLEKHYPIHSIQELESFFHSYIPLIKNQLVAFSIDIQKFGIFGDHLGLQTISSAEFDLVHTYITKYSEVIKQGIIHERRNNTYKLNNFLACDGFELQSLEMFEPKPGADVSKLKPGFEHFAMKVDKYEELENYFKSNNLPIDKVAEFGGSKFFKTKFINLVEIEFRTDYLLEGLLRQGNAQFNLTSEGLA